MITAPSPIPAPRSPRTDAERGRYQPIAPPGAQRPKDAAVPSSSSSAGRPAGAAGGRVGSGSPSRAAGSSGLYRAAAPTPGGRADTGYHCSATPQPTPRTVHSGTPPRYVSASGGSADTGRQRRHRLSLRRFSAACPVIAAVADPQKATRAGWRPERGHRITEYPPTCSGARGS